jgi:hypothetical protein
LIVKCGHAVIALTSAAIRAGGLAGEPLKLTLDIYPDSAQQIQDIFELRGKELFIVLGTIEHAEALLSEQEPEKGKRS